MSLDHRCAARALAAAALLAAAPWARAAEAAAGAISAGSLLQVVLGLALVLALVLGAARLARRFSALPGSGQQLIRVVGGAAVGQRERVVIVEVAGTWLVLGVAQGRVNALHSMPRSEVPADLRAPAPAAAGFSAWLRQVTERRERD